MGLIVCAYAWLIWSVYIKGAATERSFEPAPEVEITELHDGFYMLQGSGGNITVSTGPDGMLIVDTDERRMLPKVQAALKSLGDFPLVHVINTHSHGDHRGGNGAFRRAGADIMALEVTRSNIEADGRNSAEPDDIPNVVVQDGHEFEFNGQTITLHHAPLAHTDGDLMIVFEPANIIAAGDVFINTGLPFLSQGAGATFDGHINGQSMLLALANEDSVIVPGHGPLSDKAGLIELHRDLKQIRAYLGRLKSWGVSARALPAFHPIYVWPRERFVGHGWEKHWVRLIYNSLPDN